MHQQVVFWAAMLVMLIFYFGRLGNEYIQTFYFASFLLPIAIGTAYFFNQFLVKRYLLPKKYRKFVLFLVYTLIISIDLEMIVLFMALIIFSNYQAGGFNPLTTDVFSLSITLYLAVILNAFIHLVYLFRQKDQQLAIYIEQQKKNTKTFINVRSNRKTVRIELNDLYYLESLGDYVLLHLMDKKVVTKEKISQFEKILPDHFLRIHRSYIINSGKMESFNKEEVQILQQKIPISRTYKSMVQEALGSA